MFLSPPNLPPSLVSVPVRLPRSRASAQQHSTWWGMTLRGSSDEVCAAAMHRKMIHGPQLPVILVTRTQEEYRKGSVGGRGVLENLKFEQRTQGSGSFF
jgi:hypothetical protein